jgi:hypothetical protein
VDTGQQHRPTSVHSRLRNALPLTRLRASGLRADAPQRLESAALSLPRLLLWGETALHESGFVNFLRAHP